MTPYRDDRYSWIVANRLQKCSFQVAEIRVLVTIRRNQEILGIKRASKAERRFDAGKHTETLKWQKTIGTEEIAESP
jgi:hypothetical protein